MMSFPYEDEGEEWPIFLPFEQSYVNQSEEQYLVEEQLALPHKERGNAAYRNKRFEEALMHYTKALHQFSIFDVAVEKMKQGFLLGTIAEGCGANSNVQMLGNVAFQLERRILSFLYPAVYFAHRFPAIVSGNISIVLRALKRPGAFEAAARSYSYDPTYTKALSLMSKATTDPHSPVPKNKQAECIANFEWREEVIQHMQRSAPTYIGVMATGVLRDPLDFAVLEQSRVNKDMEAILSSDAYLNFPLQPSPKSVSLSLSLVPHVGPGPKEGQWLVMNLVFLDTSHSLRDEAIEISTNFLPEMNHIHFARADRENGDDVEAPPKGKASPTAIAFVLERVPLVARALHENWGLNVGLIKCGQALKDLTGPNGPDHTDQMGIGPLGMPIKLPSVESRTRPAREFREIDLGPDTERLWSEWDDFSRDIKVVPTHSTYAEEKALGRA